MPLSPCALFLMEDSSDSGESDLDELLDNEMEQMVVLLAVKELTDGKKKYKVVRLCTPRNHALGNDMLMRGYFAEVSTYSPHLLPFF